MDRTPTPKSTRRETTQANRRRRANDRKKIAASLDVPADQVLTRLRVKTKPARDLYTKLGTKFLRK